MDQRTKGPRDAELLTAADGTQAEAGSAEHDEALEGCYDLGDWSRFFFNCFDQAMQAGKGLAALCGQLLSIDFTQIAEAAGEMDEVLGFRERAAGDMQEVQIVF